MSHRVRKFYRQSSINVDGVVYRQSVCGHSKCPFLTALVFRRRVGENRECTRLLLRSFRVPKSEVVSISVRTSILPGISISFKKKNTNRIWYSYPQFEFKRWPVEIPDDIGRHRGKSTRNVSDFTRCYPVKRHVLNEYIWTSGVSECGTMDGSPSPLGDFRPTNQYRTLRQRTFFLYYKDSNCKLLSFFVSYHHDFTDNICKINLIID